MTSDNPSEKWAKTSPARNSSDAGTQFSRGVIVHDSAKSTSSPIMKRRSSSSKSKHAMVMISAVARPAVTPWKQRRIALMAVDYLSRNNLHDCACRFDVVTIDIKKDRTEIVVYSHAFDAPG